MKRYRTDAHIRRLDADTVHADRPVEPASGWKTRLPALLTDGAAGWLTVLAIQLPLHAILYNAVRLPALMLLTLAVWAGACLLLGTRIGRAVFGGAALIFGIRLAFLAFGTGDAHDSLLWVADRLWTVLVRLYWYEPVVGTTLSFWLAPLDLVSTAAVATAVFLLCRRRIRFWALVPAGIGAYFLGFAMNGRMNRPGFLLLLLMLSLAYVRMVSERKRQAGIVHDQPAPGILTLQALPLLLVPVLIVAAMPKQDEPLTWNWLNQKMTAWYQAFEEKFVKTDTEFFNLGAAGFNGRSQRLGGRIRPGSALIMTATADNRTYLRGAVYSDWLGDSWSQQRPVDAYQPIQNEDTDPIAFDLAETRGGWSDIPVEDLFPDADPASLELMRSLRDGSIRKLLFPTYSMEIQYRNLTTKSVFLPLKAMLPIADANGANRLIMQNAHGIAVTDPQIPYGGAYRFSFVQPMYGDPLLREALTLSRRDLYQQSLFRYLATHRGGAGKEAPDGQVIVRLQRLISSADDIRAEYTRLPETVPTRVRDLAVSLTEGLATDYAKASAIESWLRGSFPYTLDTRHLPEGEDFVDYFLFTEQKGYCTYFASAMTVMLREVGIPARYVEGYVMPDNGGKGNREFRITNRNAHAWTEVWFEGFGWMQFEPTPGFGGIAQYLIEPDAAGAYNGDSMPEDVLDMIERYRFGDGGGAGTPMPAGNAAEVEDAGALRLALPLLAVLILPFAWFANRPLHALRRGLLRRGSRRAAVTKGYAMLLRWVGATGVQLRPNETLREFSRRLADSWYLDRMSVQAIGELYMKVLYGGTEPTEAETAAMLDALDVLRSQVLRDLGWRRFIPFRFFAFGL